jgi:hypothetical protein
MQEAKLKATGTSYFGTTILHLNLSLTFRKITNVLVCSQSIVNNDFMSF